ncbi:IS66 family insertion sequence element accessory protein TnpB, partial [Phocaeicola plebeius]|uniref:IS66 family insertion sequence element accessory protein TnpB n=1 Tax=Phocaeicola plebeius TaxID=310297 RepID=UPI0022E63897
SDASNVYMFMSRNRKVVKILHYERGFYVLYEKRPVMGKFKKPVFTLWLMRLPNLSELKHRKARLTGESIYGLFLQSMSSWFTIITITAAEPLM